MKNGADHGARRCRPCGVSLLARRAKTTAGAAAASPWTDRLGRVGLVARGVVYLVIGALAVQVAAGRSGARTDKEGALQAVVEQPFGRVLLGLLALGLLAYVAWQAVEAAAGHRDEDGGKRTRKRLLSAGRAAVYAAAALSAVQLLRARSGGSGGGGGGGSGGAASEPAPLTARVLQHTGGRTLVALAGLVIIAIGVGLVVLAIRKDPARHVDSSRADAGAKHLVTVTGRAGQAARGVVGGVVGGFLLAAAVRFDPQQAKGLDGSLKALAAAPAGPFLLGACAVGLAAFGAFSLLEARYRKL